MSDTPPRHRRNARIWIGAMVAIVVVVVLGVFFAPSVGVATGGQCVDYASTPGQCTSVPTVGPGFWILVGAGIVALGYCVFRLVRALRR